MSQDWLEIQSFFADHKVLRAITDLSLSVKYDLAGIEDEDRATRAEGARDVLKRFLATLQNVCAQASQGRVLAVDHRSRELVDAFREARKDSANYHSVLIRSGAQTGVALLEADDRPSREALLESLEELRRIVSGHQQTSLSAIVEDF